MERVSFAKGFLNTLIVLVIFLVTWELIVDLLDIPRYVLPSVSSIISTTLKYSDYLLNNLLDTLLHAIVGLALAAAISFILSIPLAYSEALRAVFNPLIAGFNAIPRAALVPLLVVWFGLGGLPRMLTAFLIAFYPILVPTLTAMVTLEAELWELMYSFGARKTQVLVKVAIPRAMPYFLSSLHLGLAGAVVGTVIAEMIASDRGIGYVILSSTSRLDTPLAFACLFLLAITTFILSKIITLLEKRLAGWAYRASSR